MLPRKGIAKRGMLYAPNSPYFPLSFLGYLRYIEHVASRCWLCAAVGPY
jgi:hypothetical protein